MRIRELINMTHQEPVGEFMSIQDDVFKKIAEALLVDYSSVYYVNAVTNEYYWYSVNPEFHSLSLEQGGDDFFKNIVSDCKKVIYKEDQHIFLKDLQKDRLLNDMKKGSMQSIDYRLMIGGKPVWHSLRMIRGLDDNADYFILGVINIDEEYHRRESERETARQKEVYNQITDSLAAQYDTLYYIDLETNKYTEITSNSGSEKMNIPVTGNDFFAEFRRRSKKYVHPEDRENLIEHHHKDVILNTLKNRNSYSFEYRLVVDGHVKYVRHTEMLSGDRKHLLVCMESIDDEVEARRKNKDKGPSGDTYAQIAESLAAHYDMIYYVDAGSDYYTEYSTHKLYGELEIQEEGEDFFGTADRNADRLIYPEDRSRIKLFLDKDKFITGLENSRQLVEDYRMVVGGQTHHTRMTIRWSSDRTHFIICIENRDKDVKEEQERLLMLARANEAARRDSLTGAGNITAYNEAEHAIRTEIEDGIRDAYAVVICDINELKHINDTQGHKAGDDYIKTAFKMICRIFSHSPVFRIGGDEFCVILKDDDYESRNVLMERLKTLSEENMRLDQGPVIAAGLAEYSAEEGETAEDLFRRADDLMYQDKARLKSLKFLRESYTSDPNGNIKLITEDRRTLLDALFRSYEVVSEGAYVYVCDMKFDYSKWSKTAVDKYGLPSEYMYGAGDIWEEFIHPDDRDAYRKNIADIFSGNASGHNMQYRARKPDGEYDVCTCKGIVLRDKFGDPDYFVGTIRSNNSQGHVDTLTGLRNQYGFFEDLESFIKRQVSRFIFIVGISKFSEINEVYGYHFGNRVLQLFGRKMLDYSGKYGSCYRLDGTKFAIISAEASPEAAEKSYTRFRTFFRESFQVDGRKILLEVNCGALQLDRFELDFQTVYACLNFAYVESKSRHQGDMVLFHNDLNEDNRERIEKLHAIRASIMHGYRGFYLLYQPVVDAKTEKLIGAEALLRWKNDKYGMVPPDQFIPLLESDPLFPELGEWIIREALIVAKRILKQNPDFVININLSYTQLEKLDFVDMVFRVLDDIGYPPEHICFEVTERCRLLDIDLLKNVIASLKSRGILVALDDFGTGFSSIGIVKELPFDIIKIDRGFVMRIEEDEVERELIKYFAGFASLFGAKVCVEGIETEGMRDILQKYHVESFQGYYYAKPLQAEEIVKWENKSSR